MSLSLKLLGEFAVHDGSGAALSLPTRKTRALLGYLAVNADRPQPRERLMALLWSDRAERQARQSLNQALLSIRKLGGADGSALLDSDGERVTLRSDAVASDVQRLRSLIADDPAEAANLYEGPFLDGLSVPDPSFEEWLLTTRSELHALACDALENAAETSENTETAIDCSRRLISLDPLREDTHRRLMQLLHQTGERAGALRQYQACAEILERELQVGPDAATRALFEEIRRDAGSPEQTGSPSVADAAPPRAPAGSAAHTAQALPRRTNRPTRRLTASIAAAIVLVIGAGVVAWLAPWTRTIEPAPQEGASLPLPDKPSIAVLPFTNLSGDPKGDYFSDGITNDIITDLSRYSNLFVIASTSVLVYKGKAVDIKDVERDLGVRYVLEGSVQKIGNTVRINAQLIDATTNRHLWADRYDRELVNIFAVQDELAAAIISELRVALTEVERSRTARHYTGSLEAYDLFLRGRSYLRGSRQTHQKARQFFDRAIALDPDFAAAHAEKSMTYFSGFIMPMSRDPKVIKGSLAAAERAVALDPNLPLANARLGWALFASRRHKDAITAGKRAVALGPSDAESHAQLGNILNWTGKPEEAIPYLERAMRLNPHHPFYYRFYLGHSHYLLGHREQAIELMERVVTRAPYFLPVRRHLAVLYEEVGESEKAKAQTKEVLRIFPGASIEDERARCFYMWKPALQMRFFDGLRKSEMPEGEPGREPVEM